MPIGERLRKARLEKNLSTSQVAAATRMKIQVVEALERDDFSHIAAPIYAKGFIRLYAELMGLDAQSLVEEYLSAASVKTPSLISEASPAPPAEAADERTTSVAVTPAPVEEDLFSRAQAATPLPGPAQPAPAGEQAAEPPSAAGVLKPAGPVAARPVTVWSRLQAFWAKARETLRASPSPWKTASLAVGCLIILVFLASVLSRWVRGSAPTSRGAATPAEKLNLAAEPPEPYAD